MKLVEVINQYIAGVREYGVNWAPAGGVPLLFRAIVYAAPPSKILEGEEDLAYSIIDLFIQNDFDVNKKFGPDQKTAIDLAKSLGEFDGNRCYKYLLNMAFEQPASATEAEGDSKWSKIKNSKLAEKIKAVANKISDAITNGDPPPFAIGKLQNKIAEKITGMDGVEKRLKTGNYNLDKEGNDKGAKEAGRGLDGLKGRDFSTLSDHEKISYCYINIKGKFSENEGDDAKLKEALARKMAKTDSPLNSKIYYAVEAVRDYLGFQFPDKSVYIMIISEKYPEINELAANGGLAGLDKNSKKFSEQIKYLAYFSKMGYDLKFLKENGKWMSVDKMRDKINSLGVGNKKVPKEKNSPENKTQKKYIDLITDLGIKDQKTIEAILSKANLIKEDDDTIAMGKILKAYSQMKGYSDD